MHATVTFVFDLMRTLIASIIWLVYKFSTDVDPVLTERLRWVISAIATGLSAIAIGLLLFLSGCKGNSQGQPSRPTVIYADTTRVRLEHRAQASADTLTIVHQRTTKSQTDYETAVSHYDSIWVPLP